MKSAAHALAVHHRDHQRNLVDGFLVIQNNFNLRGIVIKENGFDRANEIGGQAARPADFDGFVADCRIEADANAVAKISAFGIIPAFHKADVDLFAFVCLQRFQTVIQVGGDAGAARKVVACANAKHAERNAIVPRLFCFHNSIDSIR